MPKRIKRAVLSALGITGTLTIVIVLSASSSGCFFDCAGYDEYCVEEDCCDDYVCIYDEIAGYRCR